MPALTPISLFHPTATNLKSQHKKGIQGPSPFVDLITSANKPQNIRQGIDALIDSDTYRVIEGEQLFWYKIAGASGTFEGILTAVTPKENTREISTHEAVLEERVRLFSDYLNQVKIQAEPVLLVHENTTAAMHLGQLIKKRPPANVFELGIEKHQLWQLNKKETALAQAFAQQQAQFHLADGHHRYASTLHYAKTNNVPARLFSFLVAKDQLQNHAFRWAIKDPVLAKRCLNAMSLEHPASPTEANIHFQDQERSIHLQINRDESVTHFILHQLMGIKPNDSINLKEVIDYYPPNSLPPNRIKDYAGIIDYRPLLIDEIIDLAKAEKQLPPKSTYILPKLPTGLFFTPLAKG